MLSLITEESIGSTFGSAVNSASEVDIPSAHCRIAPITKSKESSSWEIANGLKFLTQRIPHLVTGDVNEGVLRPPRFFRFT